MTARDWILGVPAALFFCMLFVSCVMLMQVQRTLKL